MQAVIGFLRRVRWRSACGLLVAAGWAFDFAVAAAADASVRSIEYRDLQPTIDTVDSIRVLSTNKAKQLEGEIKVAYSRLAPAVVRIYKHDQQGKVPARADHVSGVIIGRNGLVLTCSHHHLPPQTSVTLELADGKRVAGRTLGRFKLEGPGGEGPDLGLVKLTEGDDWPAAPLAEVADRTGGQVCLAIGYPGTLAQGKPPQLRAGRLLPAFPDWPWLEPTTTNEPGDSGGPLFDLQGRVIGIAVGGGLKDVRKYQSIAPLKEHREGLESGEIISAPIRGYRALRGEPAQRGAIAPAPDLEDRMQQVSRSVVRIMDGAHPIASALVIDADGWIVTKASLVGRKPQWQCRLFYIRENTAIVAGRVVATSPEHDLALMKLELREWFVAPWSQHRPDVGALVASVVGKTVGPLQVSVVGGATCPEPWMMNGGPPQMPIGILQTLKLSDQPVIDLSAWRTSEFDAYRDRFEPGDVIVHVNDIPTPTCEDFGRVCDRLTYRTNPDGEGVDYQSGLPKLFHGDWISVGIRRGSQELTVRIPRIHSVNEIAFTWHAHPLSLRREDFPAVFAHDGGVKPEECGGPVVDLDGNVVGLNIARVDTTRTFAIPADVVQSVVKELRERVEKSDAVP